MCIRDSFFAVHSLASGWVVARAQAGGGGIGQASAFYLVAYYAGSSIFGGLAGPVWAGGGWTAVLAFTGALVLIGVGPVSYTLLDVYKRQPGGSAWRIPANCCWARICWATNAVRIPWTRPPSHPTS